MITAIDTNILLDILVPNEQFYQASADALQKSAAGSLVICDIVYAELCMHFPRQHECDEFLDSNEIRVQALEARRGSTWRKVNQDSGRFPYRSSCPETGNPAAFARPGLLPPAFSVARLVRSGGIAWRLQGYRAAHVSAAGAGKRCENQKAYGVAPCSW